MKWGSVRGVSQPLSESADTTFSIMQPLSAILTSYNQSFSTKIDLFKIDLSLAWKRTTECPECKKVLQHSAKSCPRCHGKGVDDVHHHLSSSLSQSVSSTCPMCGGYGKIPNDPNYHCPRCHVLG